MLYRPNFCCNCGEKIERLEWNLLTSRRFCVVCSAEHRAHDILPRLAMAAGTLALMFGLGSLWTGLGRAELNSTEKAVGIRSGLPAAADTAERTRAEALPAPGIQTPEEARTGSTVAGATGKNVDKYFCGALTKKGTPCSRKVKAKGLRCFQHEGRPEASQSK